MIDRITVDKLEVCSGEENFVEVVARAPDGADEHLRYVMPGVDSGGPRTPFRLFMQGQDAPPPQVVVFGKNGTATAAPLPRIRVKDCGPRPQLVVDLRLIPNTWGRYELSARVLDPKEAQGQSFQPTEYVWDFGDGRRESTRVPYVEHSYEDRRQDRRFSYFLIAVEARDQTGATVRGHQGLELANRAFEVLRAKNMVMLLAQLEPRMPRRDADGSVRQRAILTHAHSEPVQLERVVVKDYLESQPGAEAVRERTMDAADLLGTNTTIGPRASIELLQHLDGRADAAVAVRTYELRGRSADGFPVMGSVSIMAPPPPATKASVVPVDDPRFEAEITTAQRLLGKQVITHDELMTLRRKGRLTGP